MQAVTVRPRYEARRETGLFACWEVVDHEAGFLKPALHVISEAEARVIAFALNAALDGALCRRPLQEEFVGFESDGRAEYEPIDYEGPALT